MRTVNGRLGWSIAAVGALVVLVSWVVSDRVNPSGEGIGPNGVWFLGFLLVAIGLETVRRHP